MAGLIIILIVGFGLFCLRLSGMNDEDRIEYDDNFLKIREEESNKFKFRRKIYMISYLSLCFILGIICFGLRLENINPRLYHTIISLLFIYGGAGGLYSKTAIIKPEIIYNKFGYVFNCLLILYGAINIFINVITAQ